MGYCGLDVLVRYTIYLNTILHDLRPANEMCILRICTQGLDDHIRKLP